MIVKKNLHRLIHEKISNITKEDEELIVFLVDNLTSRWNKNKLDIENVYFVNENIINGIIIAVVELIKNTGNCKFNFKNGYLV